jgi:hypothetical protein
MHEGRLLAENEPTALVESFNHLTLLVRAEDRYAAEQMLEERQEILALSPQGANLRLVVRSENAEEFRSWAAGVRPALQIDPVKPDFEDVFLGLLKDPEAVPEEMRGG